MIDKLAWICVRDGKVLSCKEHGKDMYYAPGGRREEGETDVEALVREIKEEVGVDLVVETIELYGTFKAQAHGKPEGTYVQMTCYMADYVGDLEPRNEIAEIAWLDSRNMDELSDAVKLIFADLLAKGLIN